MTARRVGQVLTLVVLATSATYMLVYLYRWEWNRALVSGLFFVAAEVAVVGTSLLRRLRSIEAKLDDAAAHRPTPDCRGADPRGGAAADRSVRMAAGLDRPPPTCSCRSSSARVSILSLLAHAVERIATATATPVLERRLATRLQPLALLRGGLLAPAARPLDAVPPARMSSGQRWANRALLRGRRRPRHLRDHAADRPRRRRDPDRATTRHPPGRSVEVTFAVDTKGRVPDIEETAEALWVACRGVLNRSVLATEPVAVADRTFRIVVTPAIGEHARRRLEGCLEDATLDRTTGSVVSLLEIATP